MNKILSGLSWLVTVRPALGILLAAGDAARAAPETAGLAALVGDDLFVPMQFGITAAISDPAVSGLLAPVSPVIAPTSLVDPVLQVDGFESIVDSAAYEAGMCRQRHDRQVRGEPRRRRAGATCALRGSTGHAPTLIAALTSSCGPEDARGLLDWIRT